VFKAFRGKITKGVCKKAGRSNRKNRRCTKLIFVKSFNRLGLTGANLVDFSGRYTDAKGKVGKLHPGPYKIQAYGTDSAGNVGTALSTFAGVIEPGRPIVCELSSFQASVVVPLWSDTRIRRVLPVASAGTCS